MNNISEVLREFLIAFGVATFLLNTGRALKAIELCKETLVLLNDKTLSIEKVIKGYGIITYMVFYILIVNAYHYIGDDTNTLAYGRKLLVTFRECGKTVEEGKLSMRLAEISECPKYVYRGKRII